MESYPFQAVEDKWRSLWDENSAFRTDMTKSERKLYVLVMFSYPSEKKLHIGHWWNYGPTDTFARFKRMQGFNVFEPMGFDAFGLPAENYAIKHGVHPGTTTRDSVKHIREQIKQIGAMYDWNHQVDTSTPEYYRWTQWLFLKLFEKGAAYRKKASVNWCPQCQTVLANEQVKGDGSCDRCGATVGNRDLEQWFFRITDFADALLEGLDRIQWPDATKAMQRNWIGRSEGSKIVFKLACGEGEVACFTTRADTLLGVTYIVLAPEHPLVQEITIPERLDAVAFYVKQAKATSDIDRVSTEREKRGVFTGSYAVHPITKERLPVWVADYVLGSYGTGAVMAVPAHDQRDFLFAQRYNLPIKWVINPTDADQSIPPDHAFEDYGVMVNSGVFDGQSSAEGKSAVTAWLAEHGLGEKTINYRLRDWSVSRQRYWGAPIPVIHCQKCGVVPVPETQLPVLLPEEIADFKPRGSSPLGALPEFMNVDCPSCGGAARRDPDTMDTFVDSSWYFLRYPCANRVKSAFDSDVVNAWLPVDVYVGGPEHSTGHLIYARYITKFLHSLGLIDFDEPFTRMVHQGIIQHNGVRMSKSKGNVVNPDAFVERYGSDCFRLYLMFMGDYTVGGDWSDEGIVGVRRFQNRVWRLFEDVNPQVGQQYSTPTGEDIELNRVLHYTIKNVSADLEQFQFNTAISRLMELTNAIYARQGSGLPIEPTYLNGVLIDLAKLLAPMAPHMAEELWEKAAGSGSIFDQIWPEWNPDALEASQIVIAVQVNGKLIETIRIPKESNAEQAGAEARKVEKIARHLADKEVRKQIYVPGKILNFVV